MKKTVLIVAHPDDEVIFFSSILEYYSQEIHVLCLTDGNADNRGKERALEFKKSMDCFAIKSSCHETLPDRYDEPLCLDDLRKIILENIDHKTERIFTHGPFGEYGHPHHIQASLIAHEISKEKNLTVFTPNVLDLPREISFYSSKDETEINKVWKKKLLVLEDIYKKEYQRFVTLVPPRCKETFLESDDETIEILNYLVRNVELRKLDLYSPFEGSLKLFKEHGLKRVF
jgi:LmbE family N-acetylglucosaminyl deacetylase